MNSKLAQDTLKGIMWVSGVFASIIGILWIATFIQLKLVKPLEQPSLQILIQRYSSNPQEQEIKEQIRALDFLARKAFFTSQTQIRRGSYLFVGSLFIFLVCTKLKKVYQLNLPALPEPGKSFSSPNHTIPQFSIVATFIICVGFVSWCGVFLHEEFKISSGNNSPKQLNLSAKEVEKNTVLEMEIKPVEDSPNKIIAEVEKKTIPESKQDSSTAIQTTIREPQAKINSTPITSLPTQDISLATSKTNISVAENYAQQFPCFRGPYGLGLVKGKAPIFWNGEENKNIIWKTKISKPGFNSPIIWDKIIFASGADTQERYIYAWNAIDGSLIWEHVVKEVPGTSSKTPKVTKDTGYAAPTLATDGSRVYGLFANGDLVAIDFQGNRVWAKSLGLPKNHYGHSSSLYTYQNLLLVQYDHDLEAKIMVLESPTGNVVWQQIREVQISWASPLIIPEEPARIVLSSTPHVMCYEIATGKLLWSSECMGGEVAPSPAFSEGKVYVTNVGIGLTALDAITGEMRWEIFEGEFPDVASPVAYKQYVFIANSNGGVTCLKSDTGEILWQHEFSHGFYSSPMIVQNQIYLTDRQGTTYIVALEDQFNLIATCVLGDNVVATPAFAHGYIYLRGVDHLFCIGEQ